ncbi:MAG: T9SS type A sorting domain-containing protein [Bacteroidota bacterium]
MKSTCLSVALLLACTLSGQDLQKGVSPASMGLLNPEERAVGAILAGESCEVATDISDLFLPEGGTQQSAIYSNVGATTDESDGTAGTECLYEATNNQPPLLYATQWFSFVGDGSTYSIEVAQCEIAEDDYLSDSQLMLYAGTDCTNRTPVVCNDDINFSQSNFAAGIQVLTEPGQTYYLMLDGYRFLVGSYCLLVTEVASCDDISTVSASLNTNELCFGDTLKLTINEETTIPTEPVSGYTWFFTAEDISGSSNPFNSSIVFGTLGDLQTQAGTINLIYTDAQTIIPGQYYLTPVVFGGAVSNGGTVDEYDYSEACIQTGNSILVDFLPPRVPIEVNAAVTSDSNPPTQSGSIELSVINGADDLAFLWNTGAITSTITGLANGEYSVTITDVDGGCPRQGVFTYLLTDTSVNGADSCTQAIDISSLFGAGLGVQQTSAAYSNINATSEETDPEEGAYCFSEADNNAELFQHTVWFSFTGDGKKYELRTANCGNSNYLANTQIAIYSGYCDELVSVACDENISTSGNQLEGLATLQTTDGETYYVLVDGANGDTGSFCLQLVEVAVRSCTGISIGNSTAAADEVCANESVTITMFSGNFIPTPNEEGGFLYIMTSADISNSTDPFDPNNYLTTYTGYRSTAASLVANFPTVGPFAYPFENGTTYYITPVIAIDPFNTSEGFAYHEFDPGCALSGMSHPIVFYDDGPPVTVQMSSTPEIDDSGDGTVTATPSGGTGSYTYQWNTGDTTATVSNLEAGFYEVTVSDASPCIDPVSRIVIVDMITNVNDEELRAGFITYPNPASEFLWIRNNSGVSRRVELQLVDAQGRVLIKELVVQSQGEETRLAVGYLPAGLYSLRITEGEKVVVQKVIIN